MRVGMGVGVASLDATSDERPSGNSENSQPASSRPASTTGSRTRRDDRSPPRDWC